MADFLFLGNDEIENQIQRGWLMTKKEKKILLLGAGELGKVRLTKSHSYYHIVS